MEKITFSIAAADVNLLDTTPYLLWAFSTTDHIIVPKLLKLQRDAGTAYSVTSRDKANRQSGGYIDNNIANQFEGGEYLQFFGVERRGSSPGNGELYGPLLFEVPIAGFLDQALVQYRVAVPQPNLTVFGNGVAWLYVRSSVPLASGTGSLKGSISFERHKAVFA
jgi:hypothetical protein